MKSKRAVIGLVCLALVSCASYRPIVDMKGVDAASYERDLAECQKYAEQINPAGEAVAGAIVAALLGAALGAVTGSFYGDAGFGAAYGSAVGGTAGAAAGGASGAAGQVEVIKNCLRGRGYNVLR